MALTDNDKAKLITLGWMGDYTEKIKTLFATRAVVGELKDLNTKDKSNIVAAINEAFDNPSNIFTSSIGVFPSEGNDYTLYVDTTQKIIYTWDGLNYVELISAQEINEVNEMVGATSTTDGSAGTVPAPLKGDENKFLKADGTWTEIPQYESDFKFELNSDGTVSLVYKD